MDILCVGEPEAPENQSSDPSLLEFAETSERILVTYDKKTMPDHLKKHFGKGKHTMGVVLLRQGFPLSRYVEEITLIWQASEKLEWRDQTVFVP